jgi:TPR repeat protein
MRAVPTFAFAVLAVACHGRDEHAGRAIAPDPSAHQRQRPGAQTGGDDADIMSRLRLACDGGDADSCLMLGDAYEHGRGVVESFGLALEVYEKGCKTDSAESCRRLGDMYAEGRGVAPSPTRARELWSTGCDGGDGPACAELAGLYATGRGVKADRARATALYARACAGGVTSACAEAQRTR